MANPAKQKAVQAAQKYISKGQYKKASAEYEKIVREDPRDIRARLKLADLYLRQKDVDRAVAEFLSCAAYYEEQGFRQKAVAVYKQLLGIVPGRVDLQIKLADNYRQLGRANDAAAQYYAALGGIDPGDHKAKLDVVRQMLELDPENVTDRVRLAEAYVSSGNQVDAIREYRRVVEALDRLRDNNPSLTAQYQAAAERYLFFKPDDSDVSKKLASTYVATDQPERALPKLKVAYRKSPNDLETLGVTAEAFDQLGQTHKAVTVYKEMARLYGKSGLERERDDCLRKILEVDPTDESARQSLGETTSEVTGTTIEFDGTVGTPQGAPAPPPRAAAPGPPPPPGGGDDLVDSLIAQAAGRPQAQQAPPQAPPQPPVPKPAAPPPPPPPRAAAPPPPPKPAAPPPPVDDDLSFDDDDDDDVGFGAEEVGEKTLVDNLFIPDNVLADVQAGLDWAQPAAEEQLSQVDRKVREDLRELDFYIKNGLKDEAMALLEELVAKHGEHAEIAKRRQAVQSM